VFTELCNIRYKKIEVVVQKNGHFSSVIFEFQYPYHFRVFFGGIAVIDLDGLTKQNPFRSVFGVRIQTPVVHVVFFTCNGERAALMNLVKSLLAHRYTVNNKSYWIRSG